MIEEEEEKEEQERQRRERICAAIAEQIQKLQNQKVIEVKMKRKKRHVKTVAEMLAEVDMEED